MDALMMINFKYQKWDDLHAFEREKKNSPDKGLEPLALRLKVSRSTDWANRASNFSRGPLGISTYFSRLVRRFQAYDDYALVSGHHHLQSGSFKW